MPQAHRPFVGRKLRNRGCSFSFLLASEFCVSKSFSLGAGGPWDVFHDMNGGTCLVKTLASLPFADVKEEKWSEMARFVVTRRRSFSFPHHPLGFTSERES